MPLYEFKCVNCGVEFELLTGMGTRETSCVECDGICNRREVPTRVSAVFSAESVNTPFDSKVGKVANHLKKNNQVRRDKKDDLIRKHSKENPDANLCGDGNNYYVTKPDGTIVDKTE